MSQQFRFVKLLIWALGLTSAAPIYAHPELRLSVASHIEPAKNQKENPTDESFLLVVTLGHTYLSIESKGLRTIYDFQKNRLLSINLQDKTYEDYSLYSDIGFRVMEFYNRQMLAKMLQSAKIDASTSPPAFIEHLFSLTDAKANTSIETVKHDHETVYAWQKHPLATVSNKLEPLPAAYQSEYWRFIRYYAGGHPKILADLSATPGVPSEITFVLTNFRTETRKLTLQSISTTPDTPYSLAGYTLKMPDTEPYKTLATIGEAAQEKVQMRSAAALKDRDAAYSQGRYFESFLANMEATLSTGDSDSAWLASARDTLMSDPQTQQLLGSISPKDQAGAELAVANLSKLRGLKPSYVEVLDVFEGNTRLSLKQGEQGSGLLLNALHVDPYFTGAWHDVGDYYYRTFQMQAAWACMDAARSMRPGNPMLQSFNQLEKELRTRNPEFF